MSDYSTCHQCGAEIEEKGIHFRNHIFCCDECCEDYEKDFQDKDEPELEELEDSEDSSEEFGDDLGYRDKDDFEDDEVDPLDDDFDIKPEDF